MQARTLGLLFAFFPAALAFAGAPRYDRWEVIGPGGGGGIFLPTISPHDANLLLVSCDMTGAYISHDGGRSWRMTPGGGWRSEEHTSELQSLRHLVCRLL